MPTICVAACCSNQKDEAKGISLHVIPFFEDERPEADGDAKAPSLSCLISYSGDELSGDSSEFSALNSTSSSDEDILLSWVSSTS